MPLVAATLFCGESSPGARSEKAYTSFEGVEDSKRLAADSTGEALGGSGFVSRTLIGSAGCSDGAGGTMPRVIISCNVYAPRDGQLPPLSA